MRRGTRGGRVAANRECRLGDAARPFGVYRPLTVKSATAVREALGPAVGKIAAYLGDRGKVHEDLTIKGDLGATFVPRWQVISDLRYGALRHTYDFDGAVAALEQHIPLDEETLEVPLGETDTFSPRGRRIGAYLARTTERSVLWHQAGDIRAWIKAMAAGRRSRIAVRQPNHVTFLRYGEPGGPEPLCAQEEMKVLDIVHEHLREAGIGSVVLAPLVIGDSYSKPHPNYAEAMARIAQIAP